MDEHAKAIARHASSRSLGEAIRQARMEEAERLDQTADKRDSEIARLELLKADLEHVFSQLPAADERFTLALVPTRPARLWVDIFTYVAVEEVSGSYVFVRNSEHGRRTLYSTVSVSDMADRITRYMAREIVRRERQESALLEPTRKQDKEARDREGGSPVGVVISAFLLGLVTGAAGLLAAVWLSAP